MIGSGIAKGLLVTLKHFFTTYIEDFKYLSQKSQRSIMDYRVDPHTDGIYTFQYPEETLPIPENFRFLPFLITDYEGQEFEKRSDENRCTSCGICAKACPPQCIWIVRTTDPKTGRPIPQPQEFYIDTDICMNCGYCVEFCPFDAIVMDHDFALADYAREDATHHIHDLDRLMKPASYYKEIRPTIYARREQERIEEEAEKQRKAEEKAKKMAEKKAAAAAKEAAQSGEGETKPAAKGKRSPEEVKAQREAMMAKRQAKAATDGEKESPPEAKPKRTPEEVKAQREAMMAKRQAKQEGKDDEASE